MTDQALRPRRVLARGPPRSLVWTMSGFWKGRRVLTCTFKLSRRLARVRAVVPLPAHATFAGAVEHANHPVIKFSALAVENRDSNLLRCYHGGIDNALVDKKIAGASDDRLLSSVKLLEVANTGMQATMVMGRKGGWRGLEGCADTSEVLQGVAMVKPRIRRLVGTWRRLAVPLLLVALGTACGNDKLTEVSSEETGVEFARGGQVIRLIISPDSVRTAPGQRTQFTVAGLRPNGSKTSASVSWKATGGTITSAGLYTAGSAAGSYRVTAYNSKLADTSAVTIADGSVAVIALSVTPAYDTLASGTLQKFVATGRRSDGSTIKSVPVKWKATGGTIDTSGVYKAGSTTGAYQVIATQVDGSLADTARVNITSQTPAAGVGCQAKCLYVASTGSDNNPGTSDAPFRTIQKAAGVVVPGDTVVVRDGVYTGPSGNLLGLSRAGTATAWITFRAEHKWQAKLDGRSNASDIGINFLSSANYNRVEGFELYGTVHGVQFYNGVQHAELVGNHVHDVGRSCTNTSNGQSAIFVGGGARSVLISRNLVHDIGRYAPGESGCSPTNSNYQNHDHGIYVAEADDVTISNNVLYNVKRGFMIQRYSSAGYIANNVWILNNTFAFPNPYRDAHITVQTGSTNLRVENNIFYDPLRAGVNFASLGFSGLSVRNNLTYSGVIKAGSPSGGTFSGNLDDTDPLITSASAPNFRLQAGSPAVDDGLTLSEVRIDFDAVSRAQGAGYDRGAFER